MDDLLDRMAMAATVVPCVVPHADLLRLAGHAHQRLYKVVLLEPADPVSVNVLALLEMVREAQERASSQSPSG